MQVEMSSSAGLRFPTTCPCCGEPADDKEALRGFTYANRKLTMHTWEVPTCKACKAHASRHGAAAGMPPKLAAWEMLLVVVTIGLYAVVWKLAILPKKEAARQAKAEEERAAARAMCKPTCNGAEGMKLSQRGEVSVFEVPSATYAKAFAAANEQALAMPPDRVRALLQG